MRVFAAAAFAFLACSSAAVAQTVSYPNGMTLQKVEYAELPGWQEDHHSEALRTFLGSCAVFARQSADAMQGSGPLRAENIHWRKACGEAEQMQRGDDLGARSFFERQFVPFAVGRADSKGRIGKFTGYYEPMVTASRHKKPGYEVPVYARPADLPKGDAVYPLTRADIDNGALANKGLELVWLQDPIDLFFLQVQGSGQVILDNGERVALRFDGKTNQPYTAIGKVLVERGELTREEVSAPAIRHWLQKHPSQSRALMQQNKSYVFFSLAPVTDNGPTGAQNVPLTPERSLAVDASVIPLGMPVYLTTRLPNTPMGDGTPYNRLMVAQDTGSAIIGAVRGDVFFGNGERAEALAGHMNSEGGYYVLVPRRMADQLAGSQIRTY